MGSEIPKCYVTRMGGLVMFAMQSYRWVGGVEKGQLERYVIIERSEIMKNKTFPLLKIIYVGF